jgi:hypothetical protein
LMRNAASRSEARISGLWFMNAILNY